MFSIHIEVKYNDWAVQQYNTQKKEKEYGIGAYRHIPGRKKVCGNAAKLGIVKRIKQPPIYKPRKRQPLEIGNMAELTI